MATYKALKFFSKKKKEDSKEYTSDDVRFYDKLRIAGRRLGDKLTLKPKDYRNDYADALSKRDLDDFYKKYKGYHTKMHLLNAGAGAGIGALIGGAIGRKGKKGKAAAIGAAVGSLGGLASALKENTKLGRAHNAAKEEVFQDINGKNYLEKEIALNRAAGSRKSKEEYLSDFAKAARKHGDNNFGIGIKDRFKKYYMNPNLRSNYED